MPETRPTMVPQTCRQTLEAYYADRLTDDAGGDDHIARCITCQAHVTAGRALASELAALPRLTAPRVGRVLRGQLQLRRRRRRAATLGVLASGLAAALLLALLVGPLLPVTPTVQPGPDGAVAHPVRAVAAESELMTRIQPERAADLILADLER